MILRFGLLLALAYLLGAVPASYLVAKWARGIDIRQYGSGNVGVSNLIAQTSKWQALPVLLFDLTKGAAMIWVARMLGLSMAQQVVVGLAAIVGHNWPVFLGFSGGRGALTMMGEMLFLTPKLGLVLSLVTFAFAPFHQLALSALVAIACLPALSWFFAGPFGVVERTPLTLGFIGMFLITVVRRLTAPRTSLTSTVSGGQLFANRLLFDRDIRDREAWIRRAPDRPSAGDVGGHD